jgi:transcriptional regulator GlxA family with amidase domain
MSAWPPLERVVEQGKVVTAAGVSSGIDMALRLAQLIAGDEVAQAIQLSSSTTHDLIRRRIARQGSRPIVQLVRQLGATAG